MHSGLLMPTLVDELNLSEVSFNKVYWFRMKNWLCSFLIVKRNLCWFTMKILLLNKAFFINIFFINNRMKIMKIMKVFFQVVQLLNVSIIEFLFLY